MPLVRKNPPAAEERAFYSDSSADSGAKELSPRLAGFHPIARDGFLVHVDPMRSSELGFALSVAAGLDSRPRRLDASFLYDATGSGIFERITAEPEYYLTRTEDRMLAATATELRARAGSGVLVELGSGTSTKTAHLLDAWCAAGPTAYVPIDVDVDALQAACTVLLQRFPELIIEGVSARYERALEAMRGWVPNTMRGRQCASETTGARALPRRASAPAPAAARTVVFLGSSLGNLGWREYPELCRSVAGALDTEDSFLVGLDLVKSPAILEAAYNDAAGWTARFTQNLFSRMNRELGTAIPEGAFAHVAFYDRERERIEIVAEATREVIIRIDALRRTFRVARGERILTEVSHKFRPEAAVASIERCGFRSVWREVGDGTFGLFLFRRAEDRGPGRSPFARSDLSHRAARFELGLLAEMRARTLDIVAPLADADLRRQHSPIMSPIVWDLGHIAHFEAEWLLRGGLPEAADAGPPDRFPAAPDNEPPRGHAEPATGPTEVASSSIYDALATPRSRRAELPLPPVPVVRQRLREVRAAVEQGLEDPTSLPMTARPGALAPRLAVRLVLQHEAQHQETILQAIALRDDLEYRPVFVEQGEAQVVGGLLPADESIFVPGGSFIMGTDDRLSAYDNERPAHAVDVPGFRLDPSPVTNLRFFTFMRADAYRRREVWSESGWAWVQSLGAQAPLHWRRVKDQGGPTGGWQAEVFGRRLPLHPDAPVVHVSWFEADAFARWSGARLPTEAEWEKAAAWDPALGKSRLHPWGDEPWEPRHANLDQRRLEPAITGAYPDGRSAYGCLQMLGDVWEWTSTWFDGYDGFESFPYREYSEKFFGAGYRVLRGGSFATRAAVARNTFRNWDLPERRQLFAGFRCARDA